MTFIVPGFIVAMAMGGNPTPTPVPITTEEPSTVTEVCTMVGDIAEDIMDLRQSGVPLSELMVKLEKSPYDDVDLTKKFLLEAYTYPLLKFEDNQNNIKREFRQKYELRCFMGEL